MADDQDTPDEELAALAEGFARIAAIRDAGVDTWIDETAGTVAQWLVERWPDKFPSIDDDEDAHMELYSRLINKVKEYLENAPEDVFTDAAREAGIDPIEAFASLEALRERE